MRELIVADIEDELTRENFRRLERDFHEHPIISGQWRHVEITFTGAVTNFKFPHKLKFVPRDLIQTWKTGAGTITWNYSLFDIENLNITTSGACLVRALVGIAGGS